MTTECTPPRLNLDSHDIDAALGRLVVVLLDTVRELLERQAVRRFAAGSLTDTEAERLGDTLAAMRERMSELRNAFEKEPTELDVPLQIWRKNP